AREHLHESPQVMTTPLIVLAVLTVLGGAINLPEFLPNSAWLEHWLDPVTRTGAALAGEAHLAHGTEYALIATGVVIAGLGIWLAWTKLDPSKLVPADQAPAETGFAKLLLEKYHVDELYDRYIVQPFVWLSRVVLWRGLDATVIDGAGVNGSA